MFKYHSFILIGCSLISFIGHYLQFEIARITPWIPAVIGSLILIIEKYVKGKATNYLLLFITIVFGIIVTTMCIKFLPQGFQPLRKRIIFSTMTFSSWATVIYEINSSYQAKYLDD